MRGKFFWIDPSISWNFKLYVGIFRQFVHRVFAPFSADLVTKGMYESVVKRTSDIVHEIGYQAEQ